MDVFSALFAIPLVFLIVLSVFFLLLPIIALVDILKSKFEGNENLLMALIVIFIPFGAIIYFIVAPSRKIKN